MVRKYFGTDGIRGKTNVGRDDGGNRLARRHGGWPCLFVAVTTAIDVVIGKDTRLSGYMALNPRSQPVSPRWAWTYSFWPAADNV